jgi:LacI family transcriptional regulator
VTLEEVAFAAGVSRPTASVIVNGARSGTRISAATREKVLRCAAEMGYRPNVVAQHLATGRANRIGFYSGRARLDCRNPFFAEILGGVFEGAEELGLDTIIHTSGVSREKITDLVRGLTLDGLVVYACPGDPILDLLGDLRIPCVATADEIENLPSVTADDRGGGAILANHLYDLGHRHILVKQSPWPPPSSLTRVAAFVETCDRLGMRVSRGEEIWPRGGVTEMELQLLKAPSEPVTAVMAWSDAVAESICDHLVSIGIKIPDDISVVGFDGFAYRHASKYNLTTIRAPWMQVGHESVRLLRAQILGEQIPLRTTLDVMLHQGQTTRAIPGFATKD